MDPIRTARAISLIFNPLFVAAPTFLAMLFSLGASGVLVLMVIAVTFGTILPTLALCGLVRGGAISDLYVSKQENRPVAFLVVMPSFVLGAVFLLLAHAPPPVTAAMFCYLGNSLVMMLISVRWKISIHASGIAGPVTALSYSLGAAALLLFILVVPVGWARIRLGAHTLSQVAAGALLTVITTWLQLRIYLTLL